jgi:hypothetical protein
MPYPIKKYNGDLLTTIPDGTVDTTTSLKLIGKNYAGYGEIQNDNFLHLLESFAGTSQPNRPVTGQIWFDSSSGGKLKFYDGSKWRTTGGAEITNGIEPSGLTEGDFWFNTETQQLFAFNGNQTFTLIGPQAAAGASTTQMVSRTVIDAENSATHAIIEAKVNGTTVFVISADGQFTLKSQPGNTITGFNKIRQGVTLYNTTDDSQLGQTTSDHRFWGTATNSERLGGLGVNSFIRADNAIFSNVVNFAHTGFTVGQSPILRIFNSNQTTPTIQNQLNDNGITFQTTQGVTTLTPLRLLGLNTIPGNDGVSDLGTALLKFRNVYAGNFYGVAEKATTMNVGGTYYQASTEVSSGTIVARTSTDQAGVGGGPTISAGSIKANYFVGTATTANYADLAEKYLADFDYEVGTVVVVGGSKEVTECNYGQRVLGVVSGKPGLMMNSELEGGTFIALKGRVPVFVTGPINKGDEIVAGPNGTAESATPGATRVFGIALESKSDVGVSLVECVVL